MGKKSRRRTHKKPTVIPQRTLQERQTEGDRIMNLMKVVYGLREGHPEIRELCDLIRAFVLTGEGTSGKIPFIHPEGHAMTIQYRFSNRTTVEPFMVVNMFVRDRDLVKC